MRLRQASFSSIEGGGGGEHEGRGDGGGEHGGVQVLGATGGMRSSGGGGSRK